MLSFVRTSVFLTPTCQLNARVQHFASKGRKGWQTRYAKLQSEMRKKEERARQKKLLERNKDLVPLIECKNPSLNHYEHSTYGKFIPLPLATKGWLHRRSAGDYFTIYKAVFTQEELEDRDREMQKIPNLLRMEDFGFVEENNEVLVSFQDLGLSSEVITAVDKMKIKEPTEIQKQGIPVILRGQNVTLCAETGCGKTLAFLLPLVEHILHFNKINARPKEALDSPYVIIFAPSRELAVQIYRVAKFLSKYVKFIPKLIVGGETSQSIREHESSEVDLVVGSLGGLSKYITKGVILTKYLRSIVLDEADSLLDENFSENLIYLLEKKIMVRPRVSLSDPGVQLIMVSATMPETLPEKLNLVMPLESLVDITTAEQSQVLPKVKQKFIRVNHVMRASLLLELVQSDVNMGNSVMIFSTAVPTEITSSRQMSVHLWKIRE